MKTEAVLFTGVAAFFAVTAGTYATFADDPAGTAALIIAFLMAALVAFFLAVQYRRRGLRPQDRKDAEIAETAGPLEFLPPDSSWPITVALGSVVVAMGVVYGLWLLLIGFGVLTLGVLGMVFEHARR
ncbi:aa3-type cytochrome oxidase subunit IV [Streptomyces viridochromogenes]|uniref:cytochrome-c oxidase n=1 Tax=Streptomyces viridochromogenes Tue57 TaxID=1160705 RepID=L8PNR2_STRVR|nr:cytochrome c oxidase subunit 4 [Streptomyces viridochromogenes]ELS57663.1 putative Integral membrane protein [Streptomyces viridochromogenes Tue57]